MNDSIAFIQKSSSHIHESKQLNLDCPLVLLSLHLSAGTHDYLLLQEI